ncbi:MAG: hypothetical protein QOD48_306 [Gaiellaceae bacterium]|jgi:uncharacterized protein YndB with AHSA1/START domain|nr:hypothetical protein [Gaiellaceae bacterium]
MASSTETAVERTIAIDASPETVWQFLVDPEKTTAWWGITASFDPRPGGEYRIEVIPGHTASGEFVELDAPRRLVYTFGWEAGENGANPTPPGSSTIEIELVPDGVGTVLNFTHRDLPSAEASESHSKGWDHYLERLAIVAPGGDPGPDPWLSGEM